MATSADVVVIGGGVIGLSTAYHLAAAGQRVVLLEKNALGEGSTCRAAGGVRGFFSDALNIEIGLRSLAVFERFGELFDTEIDLHRSGYLFLIDNEADLVSFEQNVALHTSLGGESRMISVAEAVELSPLIDPRGLLGAAWSPRDGHCTPEAVVQGYARAARAAGATILPHCAATGIEMEGDRIVAVTTEAGTISTGTVVCAAGAWSAAIGSWVGVDLPVSPLRRQIAVTEPVAGLSPQTPFTIDFSTSFYFHGEGGGLLLGCSESTDSWSFDTTRDPAWLADLAEVMENRVPALGEVGIASGWAGLYEMTPDHNAVIGRSRTVPGFLYACGFSGHGFLMGPAVGEIVRDLCLGVEPTLDVSALDVERFATTGGRRELNIV
ncbi:FAD-binding oxidoreductase [Nocardioides sp. CBS4Y-1]|uniref:FAD-binding oxidoreductase n=1 Tax=Nocardioides acrostichi TaxID=2784339 RepID=A0A930UYT5_9ACTN|nr:FAD-binding oxidoreductase [Nocardioides acrostichi]